MHVVKVLIMRLKYGYLTFFAGLFQTFSLPLPAKKRNFFSDKENDFWFIVKYNKIKKKKKNA